MVAQEILSLPVPEVQVAVETEALLALVLMGLQIQVVAAVAQEGKIVQRVVQAAPA